MASAVLFSLVMLDTAILSGGGGTAASAQAADKPNILFILTNDQHAATLKHMPNVQAELRKKGTLFQNAINTYPLCCPSRATIQRGQYAHNTNIFGNFVDTGGAYPTFDALDLEKSTIAKWLDAAGYRTAHVGIYINGYTSDMSPPPGWDYFGQKNPLVPGSETIDDARAHDAMGQLRAATPSTEPFFLQVGFHAPHFPNSFESEYAGMFEGERVPRTPAFNEQDVSDKAPYIRDMKPPWSSKRTRKPLLLARTMKAIRFNRTTASGCGH